MGGNNSTEKPKEEAKKVEEDEMTLIGEGTFGKVYKKGKNVIKRFKFDDGRSDFLKELTFYGWINSLDKSKQTHFSKLITYSIYYDTKFKHIPLYYHEMDSETQRMIDKSNDSLWTVDLVLENKGRPLNASIIATLDKKQRYKFLLQALEIVKIMKESHVFHEDIYPPNFVIDESTGIISLIDYGVTFLEGQRSDERENSNTMLRQITNMMVNFAAVMNAVADRRNIDPKYRDPTPLETIQFTQKHAEDIYDYTIAFLTKHNYKRDSFISQAIGDNLLRVMYPKLHLQLYKLKEELQPSFFNEIDLKIVYDNWNDIDVIIQKISDEMNKLPN